MHKAYRLAALAAVLLIGSVTPANAIPVTYRTEGVFGSSIGTSTPNILRVNGVNVVQYNSEEVLAPGLNATPSTNATFGGFQTLGTPATGTYSVVDSFTLRIFQTGPAAGGPAIFLGSVSGNIVYDPTAGNRSDAFVLFATTSQVINAGGFSTTFRIVESDDGQARVDLLPFIAGRVRESPINGEITIAAIPEPGTMALACAALPLLGLGYVRNRRRNA